MAKLIDFKCKYANFKGIDKDYFKSIGLEIPDAYHHAKTIAKISQSIKLKENNVFCMLPFDPVIEAEALGAKIKYDDSNLGPRKEADMISSVTDLESLPQMNINNGRLAETLKAVEILKSQGETVAIEVHGPFGILNGLMDIQKLLMAWRKNPQLIQNIFNRFQDDLVNYYKAARAAGCDLLFYTDSSGSLNIIGPKYSKQLVDWFLYPFFKRLESELDRDCIVHLCPKTAFLLVGCEKATWEKIQIDGEKKYGEAVLSLSGKVRLMGQRCRKEENATVKDHLCYLNLL